MNAFRPTADHARCCGPRREFLADVGLGFTGLALGAMLAEDGVGRSAAAETGSWSPPAGLANLAPKAKSVIWLFMIGGTSHLESFDPKPALNKYAGLTIDESPYKDQVVNSPFYRKNVRDFAGTPRKLMNKLYPLQIGYRKRGECGLEVSELFREVGEQIDNFCVLRSTASDQPFHDQAILLMTCGDNRLVRAGFAPFVPDPHRFVIYNTLLTNNLYGRSCSDRYGP